MKPRNAQEREVERMQRTLPALTMNQLNWIIGQDTEKSKAEFSKTKKMVVSYDYYSVITTYKGWQVNRYFLIHSKFKKGVYDLQSLSEISQRWIRIAPDGKMELHIFELQKTMCWQWKAHPYDLSAPLSLKPYNTSWNRGGRTYFCLRDAEIVPNRRFSAQMKENGLSKAMGREDEIELLQDRKKADRIKSQRLSTGYRKKMVAKCYLPSKMETLFKIGCPQLAQDIVSKNIYAQYIERYWQSFLIARRHGLRTNDWHLWLDYVHDLDELGRDIHSPKYLVPDNIGQSHARVIAKLTTIRKAIRTEAERKKRIADEKRYAEKKGIYFGICIVTKSGITITPIKSVEAMEEEGNHMHHCVYSCGYYNHDESLILSARDKDGNRVETIEVNIKKGTIVQSRGVCNKATKFHQEIVDAMESNMWQVEEIANGRMAIAS